MDTDSRPVCPYLGSQDTRGTQAPAIDYPSFENRCFATPGQDSPLLTHQATFCVGGNHALCLRHQSLHGAGRGGQAPGGRVAGAVPAGVSGTIFRGDEPTSPGQAVKWLLFSLVLVFLLVTGGVAATFAGWQLVSRGIVDLPGELQTAAQGGPGNGAGQNGFDPASQGPLVVIVTATDTPGVPGNATGATPLAPTATPTFAFPAAVTATPGPDDAGGENGSNVPGVIGGPVVSTPTPAGSVGNPSAPTRRPTPTVSISVPTSTPTPAQTATPTRPLPTPIVEFKTSHQALPAGSCTFASWRVENVRAVFFGDIGVDGQGERRICMENAPITVVLNVLLLDGSERSYPVTVELIRPTNTPAPTATFTPVLTPTPTWTPEGTRTATPEPARYEVNLTAEGGSVRTCTPGSTCVINLGAANLGNLADEIFVVLLQGTAWPVEICRQDNSCSGSTVSVGVAAGGSRPLTLKVVIPSGSAGEVGEYRLQAESGNSGRVQKSAIVTVRITSQ